MLLIPSQGLFLYLAHEFPSQPLVPNHTLYPHSRHLDSSKFLVCAQGHLMFLVFQIVFLHFKIIFDCSVCRYVPMPEEARGTWYECWKQNLISCQSFTSCPHPKVTPSVFSISIRHSVITFIYYFLQFNIGGMCVYECVRTCTCAHMHSMHGMAVEVRGQSGGVGYLLLC